MEDLNKSQHREFVQSVITRLNTNSFQIKGMMITIVAAFLAVYGANSKSIFIVIPVPIVFIFWFFNSYYLQLERKFRGIYEDICDLTEANAKKTKKVFQMEPTLYIGGKYSFWNVLLWSALTPFYLSIILGLITVYSILENCY